MKERLQVIQYPSSGAKTLNTLDIVVKIFLRSYMESNLTDELGSDSFSG